MGQTVLVTGGAGYIGGHTVIELLDRGDEVIIIDNLVNSKAQAIEQIQKITGKEPLFCQIDLREKDLVNKVFQGHKIDSVIHFAGLKAVGESVQMPIEYYRNNIEGTLKLIELMEENQVHKIVFSSSACVYGDPVRVPITEDLPTNPTNPYGRTKLFLEEIFKDLAVSDPKWKIVMLRYFNPVGGHVSGEFGEDPNGIPNNLMPYISQVAVKRLEVLSVFGNDYDTKDGTGVRDFIHVVDLAKGHLCALDKMDEIEGVEIVNLGTGNGYSVLELVEAFKKASGVDVPYKIVGRRPGDIGTCFADPSHAEKVLGWKAEYGVERMCEDQWRWMSHHPKGLS